ncbi:hypothetical protein SAMN04488542_1481, partial [Fontibacillus panacisegetis]
YLKDAIVNNKNQVYTYHYNDQEIEKYFMPLTIYTPTLYH